MAPRTDSGHDTGVVKTRYPVPLPAGRDRVVFILAVSLSWSGCASEAPEPAIDLSGAERPVKVARARAPSSADGRSYPGTTRAPETARVGFRVTGTIERFPIEVGQVVSQGEVIAKMDDAEYRIRVREAEARVAGAETALAVAERNAARMRRLYESNAATIEQLDAATERRDGAKAELEAAQESLRAARLRLGYTRLQAPVDSWVVEQLAEEGETVSAGQPVVILGSRHQIEVRVDVPETTVVDLSVGSEAEVKLPRLDVRVTGVVTEVARAPESGTVLYPVVLRVPDPTKSIRVGMVATVRFRGTPATPEQPVLVPIDAVVGRRDGTARIFVVKTTTGTDGGTVSVARRARVRLGAVTPAGVAVTGGIAEGDRVIVAGAGLVRDGEAVRVAAPVARLPPLVPRVGEEPE